MDLFSPVTDLRGVGPARAAALQRLGIFTLYDLLAYFPRDYEDRTNPVEIAQLQPGVPACFEALVVSQPVLRRIGKGRDVTNLTVADETGKLTLHYFNQPYIKTQLHYGQSYYFYGTLLEHGMQMANPAFEEVGRPGTVTNRLLPVYPLTRGLSTGRSRLHPAGVFGGGRAAGASAGDGAGAVRPVRRDGGVYVCPCAGELGRAAAGAEAARL